MFITLKTDIIVLKKQERVNNILRTEKKSLIKYHKTSQPNKTFSYKKLLHKENPPNKCFHGFEITGGNEFMNKNSTIRKQSFKNVFLTGNNHSVLCWQQVNNIIHI